MEDHGMDRRGFFRSAGISTLALPHVLRCSNALQFPAKPNILLILSDDLGWSESGCYGNTVIDTPCLDKLALEGVRFTQAYAPAPICSPSRAAILSGRSPARLHLEFVVVEPGKNVPAETRLTQPPHTPNFPLEEITIAELLRSGGYVTGLYGKWHLTSRTGTTQRPYNWLGWGDTFGPFQQGFDEGDPDVGSHYYGYFDKSFGPFAAGEYPEDSQVNSAVAFMQRHRDHPFFLMFSDYYVHEPVHTQCRWLHEKYTERMRTSDAEFDPMYTAMVDTMDHRIGQLLQGLEELGLRDNTIVVFMSDNGGSPHVTNNLPLRGSKWNLYEGGIRVPCIIRWPGIVNPGSVIDIPMIGMDLFATFCELGGVHSSPDVPLDGISIAPLLLGEKPAHLLNRTFCWHFPFYHPPYPGGETATWGSTPHSAIRHGNEKLIHWYEDSRQALFNLSTDPFEHDDLVHQQPGRAQELSTLLHRSLQSVNARLPL